MGNKQRRSLLAILPTAMLLQAVSPSEGMSAPLAPQNQSGGISTSQRGRYADGTYTATGKYGGQPSFITVKATVKADIVTDVQVSTHATVPRSLELQEAFAAAVPKVVVGKRLDEVNVGKLAGSSGTPVGFNDAIRQIREQASSQ